MILVCPCSDSLTVHTPHADFLPSPSSFKFGKRGATLLSEESKAFQICSADLIKEIQDPELLAWELYSDDIVSETVVDEVSVVGLSGVQRKSRLLTAVRDQIAVNPAKFQKLLLVLRKQTPLKDVVNKLESTYRSHLKAGDRGTGLKGLSLDDIFSNIRRFVVSASYPVHMTHTM